MPLLALLLSPGAYATIDTLQMSTEDTQIISAYADGPLAALTEPAVPDPASTLRLGALSISSTKAATDERAHASLSRLLRQRAIHLEHCAQHAPAATEVHVNLAFADRPQLQADTAPSLATCLQTLAGHWPVPQELHGTRATLRLVVETSVSP